MKMLSENRQKPPEPFGYFLSLISLYIDTLIVVLSVC